MATADKCSDRCQSSSLKHYQPLDTRIYLEKDRQHIQGFREEDLISQREEGLTGIWNFQKIKWASFILKVKEF